MSACRGVVSRVRGHIKPSCQVFTLLCFLCNLCCYGRNNGVTHEALSALARALALHGNIVELPLTPDDASARRSFLLRPLADATCDLGIQ